MVLSELITAILNQEFGAMWFLPLLIIVVTLLVAIPMSKYIAWIMDGKYRPLAVLRWFENRLDTGPMNWKQYTGALLIIQHCPVRLGISRAFAPAGDAAQ
jgi:K+-transporting ATPase A subunit